MDYNSYLSCLSDIGYNPSSSGSGNINDNGYYAVGFSSELVTSDFPACRRGITSGISWFAAGKGTGSMVANNVNFLTSGGAPSINKDSFLAVAAGVIESTKTVNTNCDKWTINHQKKLINVRVGY